MKRKIKNLDYRISPNCPDPRFRRMSPEQRVNIALELSSSITRITMEGIKNHHPLISTRRLLELARKRFQAGRKAESSQKHIDDIRAILANTRVNKRKILDRARREGTIEILREIILPTETRTRRKPASQSHKQIARRLKTGDRELKKRQYKVASSREDVDRILSTRDTR